MNESSRADAAVVGRPAAQRLSFMATGTPASGPGGMLDAILASMRAAAA